MRVTSILTVEEAAASYDLVGIETVTERLGITAPTATDETLLGSIIAERSRRAASWCNRVFVRETLSEAFRLVGQPERWGGSARVPLLQLSRYPVASITSVTESVAGTPTTLDETDWEIDAATGHLYRLDGSDCRRDWWASKVTVAYIAGYDIDSGDPSTDLPADIRDAVIEMVRNGYLERRRDPAMKSERIDGVRSVDYWVGSIPGAGGDDADIPGALRSYRDIRL